MGGGKTLLEGRGANKNPLAPGEKRGIFREKNSFKGAPGKDFVIEGPGILHFKPGSISMEDGPYGEVDGLGWAYI